MVSFQIISDLHLEMGGKEAYNKHDIIPRAPYLALLGDIGVANADHGDAYLAFLRRHLLRFKVVFLVMGNHEAYRSTWTETRALLRGFEAKIRAEREAAQAGVSGEAEHEDHETLGEFVLLDRDSYTIRTSGPSISAGTDGSTVAKGRDETVTVLGCTLFSHIPISAAERVGRGLADFSMISDGWNVPQHNAAFQRDVAWLNNQVAQLSSSSSLPRAKATQSDIRQIGTDSDETTKKTGVDSMKTTTSDNNKVVIFTHHCPTMDDRAIEPRHKGSPLSSGFCSDMRDQLCITTNTSQLADSNQSGGGATSRFKQRLAEMSQFLPFRRGDDGEDTHGDGGDNIVRCQQSPSGIVKLWAFGHTHYNCNFIDHGKGKSGIRFYTNQQGYSFQQSRGYDEGRIVHL